MNVNCVIENKNELKLNMIMNAYNLQQIVDIPTRVSINKGTPTDDTFLDRAKYNRISVYPIFLAYSSHFFFSTCTFILKTGLEKIFRKVHRN